MSIQRCLGCMREKRNSPVCEYCGHDERMPNAPHQLPPGTVLNNQYIVGKALGQGGFGITYMGWDLFLSIPVAIKEFYPSGIVTRDAAASTSVFLYSEQSSSQFVTNRDRFVREATSLARLGRSSDTGNVVRIQNLVQANFTAYIIMEYVDGIDLRHYIRNHGGKLSVEETFHLLLPVMESLEKVHENHIVHRDISPDNIMVTPEGKTKLIDFGAAHEVQYDSEGNIKSTDAILKHGFAPIEQYQRRGDLGPWTDVYALCATIYYCLTGKFPPHATDRVVGDDDFQWEAIPGLRAERIQALRKGTAIRRQDRFQSMSELRRALLQKEPRVNTASTPGCDKSAGTGVNGEYRFSRKQMNQSSQNIPNTQNPTNNPPEFSAEEVLRSLYSNSERQAQERQPQPGKNKTLLSLAAIALAVMAGFWLLKPKAETVPREENTQQTAVETEAPPLWMDNYLMRSHLKNNELTIQAALEGNGGYQPGPVFGSDILEDQVATVTFLDTLTDEPLTSWDVSLRGNRTVVAWAEPNGELYDLYIAAEGGINGEMACTELFKNFSNLQAIHFNGAFHTDQATNMDKMFYGCDKLETVDLSGLNTSNAESMEEMFHYCMNLKELDLSGFDTSHVESMESMFSYCRNLARLNLSGFDTSNVTNMDYMFNRCEKLAELDLSSFDTSNVTDMDLMFYYCLELSQLDVSEFDTSKVTGMEQMFLRTEKLQNVSIPNFQTENVETWKYFMDEGDTLNGQPWESYFQ